MSIGRTWRWVCACFSWFGVGFLRRCRRKDLVVFEETCVSIGEWLRDSVRVSHRLGSGRTYTRHPHPEETIESPRPSLPSPSPSSSAAYSAHQTPHSPSPLSFPPRIPSAPSPSPSPADPKVSSPSPSHPPSASPSHSLPLSIPSSTVDGSPLIPFPSPLPRPPVPPLIWLHYPHRPSLAFPLVVLDFAALGLAFAVVGAVVGMVAVGVAGIGFLQGWLSAEGGSGGDGGGVGGIGGGVVPRGLGDRLLGGRLGRGCSLLPKLGAARVVGGCESGGGVRAYRCVVRYVGGYGEDV